MELGQAQQLGQTKRVVQDLQTKLAAANRKAAIRDPEHEDYRPMFKRRWREEARKLDELKHLPRGHQLAIHVEYAHPQLPATLYILSAGCMWLHE